MKINLVALIYSCFTMIGIAFSLKINMMENLGETTLLNNINFYVVYILGVIILYYGIDRRIKDGEKEKEEAGK